MATVTTTKAASEDKELLISGSEAVAESLCLADIDVVTAYPIRPYDTVMQAIAKKIANGQLIAEYIVAEGEHSQFEIVKHASTVGARVFCGSSGVGWVYAVGGLGGTPPLPGPEGWLGGHPGLGGGRPQRRAGGACPRLDAVLDRPLAGGARHPADRFPGGRGPPGVPAVGHLGRRRVPHPLPGDHDGTAEGKGGPLPAALRSRRPLAASRQPDHGRPAGERGLGHRDPAPERRGDEARGGRNRGSLRGLPACLRTRAREPVVRGVHGG